WCMQSPFDALPGVISSRVGYTGGHTENPTYEQVSSGKTGHAESIEVVYDEQRISYQRLLDVFWHQVDPLDTGRQSCDQGSQYRSAIFTHDAEQQRLAEESKAAVEQRLGKRVATEIVAATTFYPAEDYHQKYSEKNPIRYRFYRQSCGRDHRLHELWGNDAPVHSAAPPPHP